MQNNETLFEISSDDDLREVYLTHLLGSVLVSINEHGITAEIFPSEDHKDPETPVKTVFVSHHRLGAPRGWKANHLAGDISAN